jgi:hypothetical protein
VQKDMFMLCSFSCLAGFTNALSVTYAVEISKLFLKHIFFSVFHFFSYLSKKLDTYKFWDAHFRHPARFVWKLQFSCFFAYYPLRIKNYAISDSRIWSSCADFALTRLKVKNVGYGVLRRVAGPVLPSVALNVKLTL